MAERIVRPFQGRRQKGFLTQGRCPWLLSASPSGILGFRKRPGRSPLDCTSVESAPRRAATAP